MHKSVYKYQYSVEVQRLTTLRSPGALSARHTLCAACHRFATHHAIFTEPLSPEEAMGNIDALLRLPHVRLLAEEEGFWAVYREVTGAVPVRGNLVSDAHLAALLHQHGIRTLYTNDSDFRKFGFLDVRNPFAATQ